jgi:hypothetical protein
MIFAQIEVTLGKIQAPLNSSGSTVSVLKMAFRNN